MEQTIIQHMETVRSLTEQTMKKIPEEISNIIPIGFNNNIRWNFGHIAFVQEKLVFASLGEEMNIPKEYEQLFGAGTKPAEWKVTPPSFIEIGEILTDQKSRIKIFFKDACMKICQLHLQTEWVLRLTQLVRHFCLAFTMKHYTSRQLSDYIYLLLLKICECT